MSLAVAASRAEGQLADLSECVPHLVSAAFSTRCAASAFRCRSPMGRRMAHLRCDKPHDAMLKPDRAAQRDAHGAAAPARARVAEELGGRRNARGDGDVALTWRRARTIASNAPRRCCSISASAPASRVAFQLPNCIEFVVIALATLRIGAICCPLMPIFREREVAFCLRRSRARVLFVPTRRADAVTPREIAVAAHARPRSSDGDLPLQPRARHRLDGAARSRAIRCPDDTRRLGALASLSRGAQRACRVDAPPSPRIARTTRLRVAQLLFTSGNLRRTQRRARIATTS